MADLNKVFLMGRLTFDPELRRTSTGTAVTELRMATSRSWTGRDGERKEETLFVDVTVWDRQAETCCQYLKKGSSLHVEGSLKLDTWDDKTTGEKRSKIRVHADRVQFLDRRESSGSSQDDYGSPSSSYRESASPRSSPMGEPRGGGGGGGAGGGAGNGPSRSFGGPSPSPPRRPMPEPDPLGDEEEDIPF